MIFTNKYNICKCFACGVSYDIFDLVGVDYHLDNFKDKVNKIQELFLGYNPVPIKKEDRKEQKNICNYDNYYEKCIKDRNKSNYLQNRGISEELINKYKIGFDKEQNLIIFPINSFCYFARSTISNKKIKSPGNSDIWNKQYLISSEKTDLVYVTEGIIDALSLEMIDPNVKVVSINGIGNISSLVRCVKENDFSGTIVIDFDNDNPGIEAARKLKEELLKLNVNSFSNSLIYNFGSDNCKDINQALITDRQLLTRNYIYFDENYKKNMEKQLAEEGFTYE